MKASHIRSLLLFIFLAQITFTNSQELQPLDQQRVRDLDRLCKVCGLLKYYHPEVAHGKYNWDSVLTEFIICQDLRKVIPRLKKLF